MAQHASGPAGTGPPAADEVEITVLGKGYGESVVIHTGGGAWVIVDSFLESGTGEAAPLVYLKSMGIDAETDVTAVVLSHLHADHYRGIDQVVGECKSAWLYLPGVLPGQRWERVLTLAKQLHDHKYRGIDDVSGAVRLAQARERLRIVGPDSEIQTRRESSLRCVGPTSAALTSDVFDDENSRRRIKTLIDEANYTSTVLWIRAGEIRALLGADFDARRRDLGWAALVDEQETKPWITAASLVKVPHHGSRTAHYDGIYTRWAANPIAIVTSNRQNRLPDSNLNNRLRHLCAELHHTSGGASGTSSRALALEQCPTSSTAPTGAVRTRRRPGASQWTVTLFGPAWQAFP